MNVKKQKGLAANRIAEPQSELKRCFFSIARGSFLKYIVKLAIRFVHKHILVTVLISIKFCSELRDRMKSLPYTRVSTVL